MRTTNSHCRWPAILGLALAASAFLVCLPAGCQSATKEVSAQAAGEVPTPRAEAQVPAAEKELPPPRKIKDMAVAGLFFPAQARELAAQIDGFLAKATPTLEGRVRALVVPHAGYVYSGPVAAYGYKLLQGRDYATVILMAPSHYAAFRGVAVPEEDAFRTPLGIVRVSPQAAELAKHPPFAINPPARVPAPPWADQSPVHVSGRASPHTWEHAEEVQVPFLQRVLKNFMLVPLVFGEVDEADVAKGLLAILDDQTLIVASSDLSHYYPYADAQRLDTACVQAICNLDVEKTKTQEACGRSPILTLLHIAKAKGWRAVLLDQRNSGDTAGDKSRVVGYAAVAFVEPPGAEAPKAAPRAEAPQAEAPNAEAPKAVRPGPERGEYSVPDRQFLLKLARQTIEARVTGEAAPKVDVKALSPEFLEQKGCFVTLTEQGDLRGCIGHIFPQSPLYQAVMENAVSAAVRDPRFRPVTAAEAPALHIEISVLTVPRPLQFSSPEDLLKNLVPHRDGVVLSIAGHGATYLPQVWEQIADKEEFLSSLSRKAGCPRDAWRGKDVTVQIYHVEAFQESDFRK